MGWRDWFGGGAHSTDDVIAEAEAARAAAQPVRPETATRPADQPASPEAEIADLLRRGKKIEAVKVHRAAYGTGLKEALDAVEAVQHGRPQPPPATATPQASEDLVLKHIDAGNLIQAIKEYRALHGVGLKEAKEAVDGIAAQRASGGTQA